jgi:ABC-type glycerol-3-phosphate transport system substrate-binding protein
MIWRKPLLGLAALALLTSACEGTGGSAPARNGPISLSFWTTVTVAAQAAAIQQQANECAKSAGNVSVTFDSVNAADTYPKLLAAYQGGNGPDIFNTVDPAVAFAQASGHVAPVDDLISSLGQADFIPSFLNVVRKDGHVWGVPDWALHQEVWYRKDLFAARGLSIPRTQAELIADAKALDEGPNGIRGFAVPMGRVQVGAQMLYSFLYADGLYTFDPRTGKYEFGDNQAAETQALQTMLDLYRSVSPAASLNWQWGDFRTAFVHGQVAMTLDYGSVVGQAASEDPSMLGKIAAFPLPGTRAPGVAALGGGYYYVVGKSNPARERAAKDLLKCMYVPEKVARRANSRPVFALPATISAFKSTAYGNNLVVQQFKPVIDMIEEQELPHDYRYGMEHGLNRLAAQIEATTFVGDDMQAAALGRMTAATAIKDINAQLLTQIGLSAH